MKALRIREWAERYEVDERGGAAKPGSKLRAAPLDYVRWKVNGHTHGPGYRRLLYVAKTPARAEAAVVTFSKLLEIAASQDREHRGWILTDRMETATVDDLAFYTGFRASTIKTGLEILSHKDVAWIEEAEFVDDSRELPGTPGDSGELPGRSGSLNKRNENENDNSTETELNENETEGEPNATEPNPDSCSSQKISSGDSRSCSLPASRAVARMKFEQAMIPLLGKRGGVRMPQTSKEFKSDRTCMGNVFEAVWPRDGPDDECRNRWSQLMAMVVRASRNADKPLAWIQSQIKREGIAA